MEKVASLRRNGRPASGDFDVESAALAQEQGAGHNAASLISSEPATKHEIFHSISDCSWKSRPANSLLSW